MFYSVEVSQSGHVQLGRAFNTLNHMIVKKIHEGVGILAWLTLVIFTIVAVAIGKIEEEGVGVLAWFAHVIFAVVAVAVGQVDEDELVLVLRVDRSNRYRFDGISIRDTVKRE